MQGDAARQQHHHNERQPRDHECRAEGNFGFSMEPGVEEFRVWWESFEIGNKMKTLCRGLENPKNPMEGIPSSFRGVREVFHDGFQARVATLWPNGDAGSLL